MTCYRPADLALKWHCSERYIKRMLADGRLAGFRIGKLWRIRQAEVERWESQGSSNTEESGPSKKDTGLTGDDVRLARMTEIRPNGSSAKPSGLHLLGTSKDRRR